VRPSCTLHPDGVTVNIRFENSNSVQLKLESDQDLQPSPGVAMAYEHADKVLLREWVGAVQECLAAE
jgi:hypothetical protein